MIPMLGITGYSGSGKTTLLEKLVPLLIERGAKVAVIKHSHHNAQVDKAGKDSWRMKEAGAGQVIMACDERLGINDGNTRCPSGFILFECTILTRN